MGLNTGLCRTNPERCYHGRTIAVVNDTDAKNGGKSYALKITGNNHAQMLGKRIGDVVDGLFVGEAKRPCRATTSRSRAARTRPERHAPRS